MILLATQTTVIIISISCFLDSDHPIGRDIAYMQKRSSCHQVL